MKYVACSLVIFLLLLVAFFKPKPEPEPANKLQPAGVEPARVKFEHNPPLWTFYLPFSLGMKYREQRNARAWARIRAMPRSRPVLRMVFDSLPTNQINRFAGTAHGSSPTGGEKERLFSRFCDSVWVQPSDNTALIEISFDHSNATLAAEMANRICRQLTNQQNVKAEIIDWAVVSPPARHQDQ